MHSYNYFYYISNWTNIWFILYMLNIVKYNPIVCYLVLAFICLFFLIFKNRFDFGDEIIPEDKYMLYASGTFLTKIIPLYLLWIFNKFKITIHDIYAFFVLISVYLLFLYKYCSLNIIDIYLIKKYYYGPDYLLLL